MKVKIKNGRKNTAVYKKKLRQMGFSWKSTSKNNGYWEKNCEDHEIRSIERFCRRKGLEAVVYEKNYSRGDHYRKTFFDANKGLFGNGNYYWCAYCGRIFSRKNITVDHLIPVNKVLQGKEKEKYRRKLRLHGITDVNQAENLVAACRSCNLKKSTKTGMGSPRTDGTAWMAVGDPMDRPNRPGDNGCVLDCGIWVDSTIV